MGLDGLLQGWLLTLFPHTNENKRYSEQWGLPMVTMLLSPLLVQNIVDTEVTVICNNSL
jgi:hypothetical protein